MIISTSVSLVSAVKAIDLRSAVSMLGYLVATASVACGSLATGQAQNDKRAVVLRVLPEDEAKLEDSLVATRAKVVMALQDNDAATLAKLVAPDVSSSVTSLMLSLSAETDTRRSLLRALRLGGAFTSERGQKIGRREFCAPYAYAKSPEIRESADWYLELPAVTVSANAAVHERPTRLSKVVSMLSHSMVLDYGPVTGQDDPSETWVGVGLSNDTKGYVRDYEVWRAEEYHICLARIDGQWLISKIGNEVLSRQ